MMDLVSSFAIPPVFVLFLSSIDIIIKLHHMIIHIISYHLFSFHGSVQDYKIHMDMEIVIFV